MEKLNVRTVGQNPSCAADSLPTNAETANNGKMHLVVDLEKCVGCFNCMMACKDEHVGNSWLPYTDAQQKHGQTWISPEKHERGAAPYTDMCFVTKLCRHCGNAACEKAHPDAVIRRPDGIVLLDHEKSKGNRELVDACPYGMISWNGELQTAQKCTMCAHLLDNGWTEPRCVQSCPLRALSVVRCGDSEFEAIAKDQMLKPLSGGSGAPRVMYRSLYRYETCFIAGALAYRGDDTERAAIGASVELRKNGELVAGVETDFFGEFKIDRIPKDSGTYELVYLLDGYKPASTAVTIGAESVCLDVQFLERL